MGLLANNYRDTLGACRFFGASVSNGASPYVSTPSANTPGASRNIFLSDAGIDKRSSKPAGARPPVCWQLPQKAGGLASRNNARIAITGAAQAAAGLPVSGSATITFTSTATGGLIVSGSGSASISLSSSGTLISVASGSGSASITLSTSALIGALAGLQGSATVTLSPTATITAIGYLSGTSTNETEFSADALARAVWDALASDFNTAGTMGAKLNAASSAGDPWSTELPGSYTGDEAGAIVGQKLLTLAKFLALK